MAQSKHSKSKGPPSPESDETKSPTSICTLFYKSATPKPKPKKGRGNNEIPLDFDSMVPIRITWSGLCVRVYNTIAEIQVIQHYHTVGNKENTDVFFVVNKRWLEMNLTHFEVSFENTSARIHTAVRTFDDAQKEYSEVVKNKGVSDMRKGDDSDPYFKLRLGSLQKNGTMIVNLSFVATLSQVFAPGRDNGMLDLIVPSSIIMGHLRSFKRQAHLPSISCNGKIRFLQREEYRRLIDISPRSFNDQQFAENRLNKKHIDFNFYLSEKQLSSKDFVAGLRLQAPSVAPCVQYEEVYVNGENSMAVMVHLIPNLYLVEVILIIATPYIVDDELTKKVIIEFFNGLPDNCYVNFMTGKGNLVFPQSKKCFELHKLSHSEPEYLWKFLDEKIIGTDLKLAANLALKLPSIPGYCRNLVLCCIADDEEDEEMFGQHLEQIYRLNLGVIEVYTIVTGDSPVEQIKFNLSHVGKDRVVQLKHWDEEAKEIVGRMSLNAGRIKIYEASVSWKGSNGRRMKDDFIPGMLEICPILTNPEPGAQLEFFAIFENNQFLPGSVHIDLKTKQLPTGIHYEVQITPELQIQSTKPGIIHRCAVVRLISLKDKTNTWLAVLKAQKYGVVVEGTTIVQVDKKGQGINYNNWMLPDPNCKSGSFTENLKGEQIETAENIPCLMQTSTSTPSFNDTLMAIKTEVEYDDSALNEEIDQNMFSIGIAEVVKQETSSKGRRKRRKF